ncbi:UPF0687 protein C20orf27 homolog isoform X2 [Pipistrellus kuhlii]|uniref:UPF0687 protein C20orf27 homolog isoform X2 n=1 Tax=Pipistrellus kuhlii TaxID=59472 RepID=UPI001E273707|nr:UPF0687 protein C20orf27 homolog isoform X2 [Pipistrellus kuhlii]
MAAANKGPQEPVPVHPSPGPGWGHQEEQAGTSGTGIAGREGPRDEGRGPAEENQGLGNKPRVRSIRFAAGHDAEGSQSHVHFDEKLHDSVVMVTQESDSSFLVKVGFLKILHRYEITFTLPSVQRLSKDVREAPVPSLHLKLLSIMPVPEDRHHGTPMLLDGVKCVGAELEYDSEHSDWHGFD